MTQNENILKDSPYGKSILAKNYKAKLLLFGLLFLLLVSMILSVLTGSSNTGLKELVALLTGSENLHESQRYILLNLRLPRLILAVLIGGTLAIAGVALQGLFRNPLAAPGILGVNSGAALGAALVIVIGSLVLPASSLDHSYLFIPTGAFFCALLLTLLIVKVGTVQGRTNILLLLLSGIAVQAIVSALMGLLIYMSSTQQLRSLIFWTLGDLGSVGWKELTLLIPVLLLSAFMIFRKANSLNILLLGESEATHLGIEVEQLKKSIICWTTLSVALGVSFTGSIGFIGLAAPHLVRMIVGPNHKILLPSAALMGSIILVVADILSRTVASSEIPVGIITALIGSPIFLWLLICQRRAS
ncbi:MAG: iron ABC transporter permease [Lentisphaeria bacterium]|nr:iron ABC transporter permease [Lentisphaeria bacterium]